MDLSKVEHSMTSILEQNRSIIDITTTKQELYETLKTCFEKNKLNTPASNRLLTNIMNARNFMDAISAVYNSILAGNELSVLQI